MGSKLRLKRSEIHGIGVFAEEFIEKATRIAGMRLAPMGEVDKFASLPITGVIIDGTVHAVMEGFPLWYVNYSDNPNIEIEGNLIYATRSIAKDDELTLKEYNAAPND